MSGQRSADHEEGSGDLSAAGCALNETRRPAPSRLITTSTTGTTTTSGTTAAAVDDNLLFAWGRGEDGQLGLGDTNDQAEPTFVEALRNVSVLQIAAGSGHTVVL
jgi:alpha-tubulin suppressor-like RCC1 family protein